MPKIDVRREFECNVFEKILEEEFANGV